MRTLAGDLNIYRRLLTIDSVLAITDNYPILKILRPFKKLLMKRR